MRPGGDGDSGGAVSSSGNEGNGADYGNAALARLIHEVLSECSETSERFEQELADVRAALAAEKRERETLEEQLAALKAVERQATPDNAVPENGSSSDPSFSTRRSVLIE